MRTAAGQIKILDSGLARAAQGAWEDALAEYARYTLWRLR